MRSDYESLAKDRDAWREMARELALQLEQFDTLQGRSGHIHRNNLAVLAKFTALKNLSTKVASEPARMKLSTLQR